MTSSMNQVKSDVRGHYTPEEREITIREFIRNNGGTTEGKVIKYTNENNICSRDTTRNHIRDLSKKEDILIMADAKPNNRTHHLYINEKNLFNQIEKRVDDLERYVNGEIGNGTNDQDLNFLPKDSRDDFVGTITRRQMPSDFGSVIWELELALFAVHLFGPERETRGLLFKIIKSMINVTYCRKIEKMLNYNTLGPYAAQDRLRYKDI
jgi:hypothetical protein